MEPSAPLICLETPSLPCAATPPAAAHAFADGMVHAAGAAAARYLVKFSVVPESSARWTAWTDRLGRVVPGFNAAIVGSFQLLIEPAKIPASTSGVRVSWAMPDRL